MLRAAEHANDLRRNVRRTECSKVRGSAVVRRLQGHRFRLPGVQTARRLRPLARRLLMTLRPPRLFMRTRKPWVRARRIFDGWKVRFIAIVLG